jgi:hypothetical protein
MAQSALSPDAPLCYQMTSRPWSNLSSCRSRISATALRSSSKTGTGSSPPFGRHLPASCRASRAEIPVAHSDADDNACLGCMVDLGTHARMPLARLLYCGAKLTALILRTPSKATRIDRSVMRPVLRTKPATLSRIKSLCAAISCGGVRQ